MKLFYQFYYYLNNYFKLSFKDTRTEIRFQKEFVQNNLPQNRVAVIVGLLAHIFYIPVAYFSTPQDFISSSIIVISIPITLSIIFLLTIKKEYFQKNIEIYLFLYGLAIGISPIIAFNITELYYQIYVINMLLPIFAVYVMYGVSFVIASFGIFIFISSMTLSILIANIDYETKIYYFYILLIATIISAVSGYLVEKNQRRLYKSKYKQEELTNEILKKEQMLQEQTRLAQMGEMIGMIAHQWRQPLSAIGNSAMSIQTKIQSNKFDLEKEEDRKKFMNFVNNKLHNIHDYVNILSTTIDDFRNFFKPDKEKEWTILTTPIERALQIVDSSLKSKNITIHTEFIDDRKLLMYQNEIMQVILNILKNAEDNFIEKKIHNPLIKIETKKLHDNYHVIISDNGGGIAKEILPKIFDPYFSTKDEKNGTGLGLYMSKVIIDEHHNGMLSAKNENDGVSFTIKLAQN